MREFYLLEGVRALPDVLDPSVGPCQGPDGGPERGGLFLVSEVHMRSVKCERTSPLSQFVPDFDC